MHSCLKCNEVEGQGSVADSFFKKKSTHIESKDLMTCH